MRLPLFSWYTGRSAMRWKGAIPYAESLHPVRAGQHHRLWDLPAQPAERYDILLDSVRRGSTGKTHFTLRGLAPDTSYQIEVRPLGAVRARTETPKRRLDVTAQPFGGGGGRPRPTTPPPCSGPWTTCGAGDCVYFPAGVYRSGALFGHSHMEKYLDKDAVLQGSEKPEAYEPRIRSRFEGTEMEWHAPACSTSARWTTPPGPTAAMSASGARGRIRGGGYALAWNTIQIRKGTGCGISWPPCRTWSRPARARTPSPAGSGAAHQPCPTARTSALRA